MMTAWRTTDDHDGSFWPVAAAGGGEQRLEHAEGRRRVRDFPRCAALPRVPVAEARPFGVIAVLLLVVASTVRVHHGYPDP